MSFNRPPLSDLLARDRADFQAALPSTDTALRRAVVRGLADAHAGGCHSLHGHLVYISKQILAATAEGEFLQAQGSEWIGSPLPAAPAAGNITLTGTNGAVIEAAKVYRRADGVEYTVNAQVTISSGSATASVTCTTWGETGNTDAGARLTASSPIEGVNSTALVAAGGLLGGADIESDDSYRARIIDRKRNPPELGNKADYIRWAKEVPGVTRVWISNDMGPGTVVVRFVRDNDSPSIFPNDAAVDAVEAHILDQAPFPADIYVAAPLPKAVDFALQLTPDTAQTRAAVTAQLADLLYRAGVPKSTMLLSDMREAVGAAAGLEDWVLIQPAANIYFAVNEIGELGDMSWT